MDVRVKKSMDKRYYVYILNCRGRYLYTGYTVDLKRRVSEHSRGIGSRFTRSHLPIELVYSETMKSKRLALKRERAIKMLPRLKKLQLLTRKN